eukprot:6016716-Prymnesium_polylepis.1
MFERGLLAPLPLAASRQVRRRAVPCQPRAGRMAGMAPPACFSAQAPRSDLARVAKWVSSRTLRADGGT